MIQGKPVTAIKQGRYDFNDEEKRSIAVKLSEAVRKHDEIDAEKKASAKQFTLRIEENDKAIRDLAHLYKQGHEYRDYECEVVFDYEHGEKRYVRIDDGAVLERGLITADEWADYRQMKLDIEREELEPVDADGEISDEEDLHTANAGVVSLGHITDTSNPFAPSAPLNGKAKSRAV